jgi:inhibitor of cysteine peptidase
MNAKATIWGLLLVLSSSISIGCGSDLPFAPGATVDMASSGSQIELQPTVVLTIRLESNPTTGYHWEVVEIDSSILQQLGESEFQPDSELVGSPGKETFRFVALLAGEVDLRLEYRRPWEEGVDPLETFVLHVVVR